MAFVALECFTTEINDPFLSGDTVLPLEAGDITIVCNALGADDHSYVGITDGTQCATFRVECVNGAVVAVDRTDGFNFPAGSCVRFVWTAQAICDLTGACDTTDSCPSPILLPAVDNTNDCNVLDCVRLSDQAASLLDPDSDNGCSTCIATTQYVCDRIDNQLEEFCQTNPCNFLVVPDDGSCIQGVTPPDECGCDTCLATTEWVCNYVEKELTDFAANLPDACNLNPGVYGNSTNTAVITVGPDGCITSITTIPIDNAGGGAGGVESISVCAALTLTGSATNPNICLTEVHAVGDTVNGITYDIYGRIVAANPLVGNVTGLQAGNCIIITPVGGGVFNIATNTASTIQAGCTRLATVGETVAGLQDDIAVTPVGLQVVRDQICNDLDCATIGQLDRVIFSSNVVGNNTITIPGVNLAANETLLFHTHMYGDLTFVNPQTGDVTYEVSAGGGVLDTRVVTPSDARNILAFQQKFAVIGPFAGDIQVTITNVDGTLNDRYGVIDGQIYVRCECS